MAHSETQLGGLRVQGEGHTTHTGHIDASIHAKGDVVERDKITHNITHLHNYVQTIADELEEAQTILAKGIQAYLARLKAVAQQQTDFEHGNPYKGLHDYRLSDADHFFGRDEAIKELLTRMNTSALTILHAESGAGKSSLLKAGIANRLLGQGHLPLTVRPYNQSPTHAIKRDLISNVASVPPLNNAPLHDFLRQVTQVLGPQTLLCLMLDQFEEFFTLVDNETVRHTFIDELAQCLEDETLPVRWVLALRTEFFGELATFRPRIRHPFANDIRLNRLKLAEAHQVITDPAEPYQLTIEPELVDQILSDLHDKQTNEISPPHIQLVCDSLYQRLTESQQANPTLPYALTLDMYKDEECAKGILGNYLNRVLTRTLTPPERELAYQLLIALISSDRLRIRRTRSELTAILSTVLPSAQTLDALLAQLVDSRLLTVDSDDEAGEGAYELAHDYLVGELELSPEMQAQKAAQEMLEQEVKAYQQFGTLLSQDKFAIINAQASALVLDKAAQELLRQSEA